MEDNSNHLPVLEEGEIRRPIVIQDKINNEKNKDYIIDLTDKTSETSISPSTESPMMFKESHTPTQDFIEESNNTESANHNKADNKNKSTKNDESESSSSASDSSSIQEINFPNTSDLEKNYNEDEDEDEINLIASTPINDSMSPLDHDDEYSKDNESNANSGSEDSESNANSGSKDSESNADSGSEDNEIKTNSSHEEEEATLLSPLDGEVDDYDLADAEQYFNRQNSTIICRRCGEAGHKAADCPNVKLHNPCFQCAETTHQIKDCKTNICRHCNKQGHSTRDCPYRSVPPPCPYCSSRLHLPENCPMMPKPCNKDIFQLVHCMNCGKLGHLMCKSFPALQGSHYGKCAICGSSNHYSSQCRDRFNPRTAHSGEHSSNHEQHYQGACFICGKYGHIAANCPEKNQQHGKNDRYFSRDRQVVTHNNFKRGRQSDHGYAKRIRY